jgi:hypothetical protein
MPSLRCAAEVADAYLTSKVLIIDGGMHPR